MSKGRILIVEDDFDISNMLRIYFDSQGYETLVAPRGEEGLEMCRRKLPNLVILDIMLPDVNGYEVCRRLRGNLRTSHIPIIFLTQKDERSDQIAPDRAAVESGRPVLGQQLEQASMVFLDQTVAGA